METGYDDATVYMETEMPTPKDTGEQVVVYGNDGADVVYDQAQEQPLGVRDPNVEERLVKEERQVGDITGEHERPILDSPHEPIDVVINVRLAREPKGDRAIHVEWPEKPITAAQANQLAIDLTEASEIVAELRGKAGFES